MLCVGFDVSMVLLCAKIKLFLPLFSVYFLLYLHWNDFKLINFNKVMRRSIVRCTLYIDRFLRAKNCWKSQRAKLCFNANKLYFEIYFNFSAQFTYGTAYAMHSKKKLKRNHIKSMFGASNVEWTKLLQLHHYLHKILWNCGKWMEKYLNDAFPCWCSRHEFI